MSGHGAQRSSGPSRPPSRGGAATSRPIPSRLSDADVATLSGLLSPVLAAAGVDLEAVEVRVAGRRRLVRIVVDADGGVGLDVVAAASTRVSEILDTPAADRVLGDVPYTLEVSSPGVDRPLTRPVHWRRARGRLVEVVAVDGEPYVGRLVDVVEPARPDGAADVVLDVDGERRTVNTASVVRAVVQVEFGRVDVAVDGPEDEQDDAVDAGLSDGRSSWTST